MKTFIASAIAALIFIAPVKAVDFNPPEYISPVEQKELVKLPDSLIKAAYHYLAHGKILDKTLQTCQQYPYFMEVISQDIEVDEVNLWQTPQFKQQVVGGFSTEQMQALEEISYQYAKYLGTHTEIKTAAPTNNRKAWCDYKGTVLFRISIQKIYSTNYQNFLMKKDAWVQATQDLGSLVLD